MRNVSNIYFTSDTHFGHTNIIRYCNRPFSSVPAMDEAMIERWNARVGDDDVIYHLGDFTLSNRNTAHRVLSRLRGHIKVLGYPWHHDRGWVPTTSGPSSYTSASGHAVEILAPLLTISPEVDGRRHPIALCHFPLGEWDRKHHGAWHLHGHSHGHHKGAGAMLDVGVDDHDYAPVALTDLPAIMRPRMERRLERREWAGADA
jgi:calcineurin-like phosphoesterase family protein